MVPQPEQEARNNIDRLLTHGSWSACELIQTDTSTRPRTAVMVNMIVIGTDIKALEVVIFMRAVKSCAFFEKMKGHGVRVLRADDLQSVTPDAKAKDHFVIVDAVGVCEQDARAKKKIASPMPERVCA